MGWSPKSGPVRHPSSCPPSPPAAPRRSPLPARLGDSDSLARPGAVVLLFHPPQEGADTLLPQPGPLLPGVHVLLVCHRGASPRGCWPGPASGGNCRGHTHRGGPHPHQERPRHCAAKSRGRPQHSDVLQPYGRQRPCPQRGEAGCDDDGSQPGRIVGAGGGGAEGK